MGHAQVVRGGTTWPVYVGKSDREYNDMTLYMHDIVLMSLYNVMTLYSYRQCLRIRTIQYR